MTREPLEPLAGGRCFGRHDGRAGFLQRLERFPATTLRTLRRERDGREHGVLRVEPRVRARCLRIGHPGGLGRSSPRWRHGRPSLRARCLLEQLRRRKPTFAVPDVRPRGRLRAGACGDGANRCTPFVVPREARIRLWHRIHRVRYGTTDQRTTHGGAALDDGRAAQDFLRPWDHLRCYYRRGRLVWFSLQAAEFSLMPTLAVGSLVIFCALCMVVMSCYGGGYGTISALVASYFGAKGLGAVYASVFTAAEWP